MTGHITSLGHEPHHYAIFYIDVDDVAAYLPARSGAKTLLPPIDIPTGTFAWVRSRRQHRRPLETEGIDIILGASCTQRI
jgi:hypothetical protein